MIFKKILLENNRMFIGMIICYREAANSKSENPSGQPACYSSLVGSDDHARSEIGETSPERVLRHSILFF